MPASAITTFRMATSIVPKTAETVTILTASVVPVVERPGVSSEQILGNLLVANLSGLLGPVVERSPGEAGSVHLPHFGLGADVGAG